MTEHVTKEELEEVLEHTLKKIMKPRVDAMDPQTHSSHHAYVALLIEKKERNARRMEKIQQSMLGTLAAMLVAGLVWLGKVLIEGLRHMGILS